MSRIFALMVLTEDDELIHIPCKSHEAAAKAKELKHNEAKNDYKMVYVTEMKRRYKLVSKSQTEARKVSSSKANERVEEAQRLQILAKMSKPAIKLCKTNDIDVLVFLESEKISVNEVKEYIEANVNKK